MNKILTTLAIATAVIASSAHAESVITTTIGAERNLDTEINKLYFGPSIASGDFSLDTTVNMVDTTADNMKFNMESVDIDLDYSVTSNITLYIENAFDQDIKHSATVVGGKIKF